MYKIFTCYINHKSKGALLDVMSIKLLINSAIDIAKKVSSLNFQYKSRFAVLNINMGSIAVQPGYSAKKNTYVIN